MKTFEIVKNAFFYIVTSKHVFNTVIYIIRAEVEYRKRLFLRAFIFYAIGGSFLMGGIFSLEYLLFQILNRYIDDPVISASVLTLSFFLIGGLSLLIGSKFLNKFTNMDLDRLKKTLM